MPEVIVAGLIVMIFMCFGYEILVSNPAFGLVARGLLPKPQIVTDPGMLYLQSASWGLP
jgi:manganese transport protein